MPAPPWAGIAFFRTGKAGWSEVYWLTGQDYSTAQSGLQQITAARLAMSGPDVFLDATRVSDPFIFRDVLLNILEPPSPGTYTFGPNEHTGPVEMCLRARQFAGVKPYSLRWVRGIPSGQYTGNNFTPTTPNYTTLVNAWVAAVIANTVLLNRKASPPTGPYVPIPITAIRTENMRSRRVGRPFDLFRGRRLPR